MLFYNINIMNNIKNKWQNMPKMQKGILLGGGAFTGIAVVALALGLGLGLGLNNDNNSDSLYRITEQEAETLTKVYVTANPNLLSATYNRTTYVGDVTAASYISYEADNIPNPPGNIINLPSNGWYVGLDIPDSDFTPTLVGVGYSDLSDLVIGITPNSSTDITYAVAVPLSIT